VHEDVSITNFVKKDTSNDRVWPYDRVRERPWSWCRPPCVVQSKPPLVAVDCGVQEEYRLTLVWRHTSRGASARKTAPLPQFRQDAW